jgi:glucosamine-6-phosphate deaminase
VKWESFASSDLLSMHAAEILLTTIRNHPRAVLGLPTGRSPIGMYQRVVRECAREYHCFREVTTFNLDEYVGVEPEHPASYCSYMKQHLFDHVDMDPDNRHIPHGTAPDLAAECARYEAEIREAGGIDITFLGLGRNGHIGFNEPGSPFDARTRVVDLTESTRQANADFFPEGNVPSQAITMGIGTILESRAIVLLVDGRGKDEALARLQSGVIDEAFPASALWKHDDVLVLTAV